MPAILVQSGSAPVSRTGPSAPAPPSIVQTPLPRPNPSVPPPPISRMLFGGPMNNSRQVPPAANAERLRQQSIANRSESSSSKSKRSSRQTSGRTTKTASSKSILLSVVVWPFPVSINFCSIPIRLPTEMLQMEADIVNVGQDHIFRASDQQVIGIALERLQAFNLYFTFSLSRTDSMSSASTFVSNVNSGISEAGFILPPHPFSTPFLGSDILLAQPWRIALPKIAQNRWSLVPHPHAAASTFSKVIAGPIKLSDAINPDHRLLIIGKSPISLVASNLSIPSLSVPKYGPLAAIPDALDHVLFTSCNLPPPTNIPDPSKAHPCMASRITFGLLPPSPSPTNVKSRDRIDCLSFCPAQSRTDVPMAGPSRLLIGVAMPEPPRPRRRDRSSSAVCNLTLLTSRTHSVHLCLGVRCKPTLHASADTGE